MKIPINFIKNSLDLDYRIFQNTNWSFAKKFEFLIKKYKEIMLYGAGVKNFELGKSSIFIFGRPIYYDTWFGISTYQSMYGRLGKLIQEEQLHSVKTIIDVGANVGFFALMVNDLFPKALIYAFEPIPKTYECLVNNTSHIPLIIRKQIALAGKNGKMEMVFDKDNSLVSKFTSKKKEKGTILKVNTETLDNFCKSQKIKKIDLLKIDAETFELEVLRGASKTLAITKYLLLEITLKDNTNYTFSQINGKLFSKNFNFQLVSFRNYLDKGDGPLPTGDFLFENIKKSL